MNGQEYLRNVEAMLVNISPVYAGIAAQQQVQDALKGPNPLEVATVRVLREVRQRVWTPETQAYCEGVDNSHLSGLESIGYKILEHLANAGSKYVTRDIGPDEDNETPILRMQGPFIEFYSDVVKALELIRGFQTKKPDEYVLRNNAYTSLGNIYEGNDGRKKDHTLLDVCRHIETALLK